jgi:gas vesicle protein
MQKILFFFIEMCAIPVYAVYRPIPDASRSHMLAPDVAKAYIKWFTQYQSTLNDLAQDQYNRLTRAIHQEKEFADALAHIVIEELTQSTHANTAQCQNRVNHAYNNALHTLTGEKKAQVLNQKKTRHKQWIKRVETHIQCFPPYNIHYDPSDNNDPVYNANGVRSELYQLKKVEYNQYTMYQQLQKEQENLTKEKKRLLAFKGTLDTLLQTIINDQKASQTPWHDAYQQEQNTVQRREKQPPEPTLYLDYSSPAHIQELFNEANSN